MLESCGVVALHQVGRPCSSLVEWWALRQMDRRCSLSWQWWPFIRWALHRMDSQQVMLAVLFGRFLPGCRGQCPWQRGRTRAWLAQTRPASSKLRARVTVLPAGAPPTGRHREGSPGPRAAGNTARAQPPWHLDVPTVVPRGSRGARVLPPSPTPGLSQHRPHQPLGLQPCGGPGLAPCVQATTTPHPREGRG